LVEPGRVAEDALFIGMDLSEERRDGESEGNVSVEEGGDHGFEESLELGKVFGRKCDGVGRGWEG